MTLEPPTAACCFCQKPFSESKRTKEHIIPQWLLKKAGVSQKEIHSFGSVRDNGSELERNTPAYSHVYKRVCSSCNSGWLSDLESEVQRILEVMLEEKPF